jgi:hypothetical protein
LSESSRWRKNWHRDTELRGTLHAACLADRIGTAADLSGGDDCHCDIGHLSTVALSAVGVVNMTVTVIQSLLAILSMGVTVVIAV